ncbi:MULTISPECIES: condensation domain-containing protein [unclassified Streptomyces]|uniref:condensation domain-containing protein n=1 Tax=unclassified Streptomyces TaxID=2593676 RepID=UPI000F6E2E59|nr:MULTISPECIES: condensation domain-containing protein [unclassified Streptomyces]AZM62122.1 hypothetical protein DLM49_23620 [Streptomyces sp. WAC 01438]RSN00040.1 hypothetical protein DMA10_04650 [Streptomyces sp. WAC 01420]
MKGYPLTAAQINSIAAAGSLRDLDSDILPVTLTAEERVDLRRLTGAVLAIHRAHPVLRVRVVSDGEALEARQYIEDCPDEAPFRIRHVSATDATLADAVNDAFATLASALHISDGPVWGMAVVSTESQDHLVFAFSHFAGDFSSLVMVLRNFVRAYQQGDRARLTPDSYVDFLESIPRAAAKEELPAEARWWLDRPWLDIPLLPGTEPARVGAFDVPRRTLVHTTPWDEQWNARSVERAIVVALLESIHEVSAAPRGRVDLCRHGRSAPVRRSACGWMSQAIPHIVEFPQSGFDASDCAAQLDETERHEHGWDAALEFMRGHRAPSMPVLWGGAQAFVNYWGGFDPARNAAGPFSFARVQPDGSPPRRRRALKPIELTVHGLGETLRFTWDISDMFQDPEVPEEIVKRAMYLLQDLPRMVRV